MALRCSCKVLGEAASVSASYARPLCELRDLRSMRLVSNKSKAMYVTNLYVAIEHLALTELVLQDAVDPELDLAQVKAARYAIEHIRELRLSGRYNLTPMRYARPRKMRAYNIGSSWDREETMQELFNMQLDILDTLSLCGLKDCISLALPHIGALADSLTSLKFELSGTRKWTQSFVKSMVGELTQLVNLRELTISGGEDLQQMSNASALSQLSKITSLQTLTLRSFDTPEL